MNAQDAIPESGANPAPETEAVLFRFLLEHIPDRIYFKNKASRFIQVSRAKAERHGIADPSQLIGKTDLDLFTAEHATAALADEQHILCTGESIVGKVEKETLPDGRTEWALTSKMPLRTPGGEIIGTCGISKDITALKEMEDALAVSNADLSRTLKELQHTQGQLVEAEKAQTAARLAAGVAHEVRNPLNILNTGIEFLSTDPAVSGDETLGAVVTVMREAIRRADAVICTLMDSSKDQALDLETQNLHTLIDRALESCKREIATQRVAIMREFAPDLPALALDGKKFITALDCLLRNALDAIGTSRGTITIRTKLDVVSSAESEFEPGARSGQRNRTGNNVVVLELEDNGCGIPAGVSHAIFDPFFTTKPTGSGTGLGLTICRKILELHHASITVANRPEAGATARIVFPC